MTILDMLRSFWPHLLAVIEVFAVLSATIHVLLNKRDVRATVVWLVTIWFLPLLGSLLYVVLGVNRIQRRARKLLGVKKPSATTICNSIEELKPGGLQQLRLLARMVDSVSGRALTNGNQIEPLVNGDEAFPLMLEAIESATTSISLTTYIFDNDPLGRKFVDVFKRARERGVEIRVLVDSAGIRYSWPPITHLLAEAGIPYGKFLPTSLFTPWKVATINLRNHRKLMVVDGRTAYTGGMNIRQGNLIKESPENPVQDLHFRITGPLVAQLQEAFALDWSFTKGENLTGEKWFPSCDCSGNVVARVITDGPDEDYDKLRWTLLAALAEAQSSVQIVTPYFLPDSGLITALNMAALREVRVDIILPESSNLPYVHWASRCMWWQVLERGCHIWLTPPPFDHSKLMIVDGQWVFLGSANWDARSLRLNFELNVEAYGKEFATKMAPILDLKLRSAREVTLAEVDGRSVGAKLRDSVARLFSPYL